MSFRLNVPAALWDEMIQHARAERPYECCGLLAGTVADGVGKVERLYRLENAAASPVEYESEPRSMLAAMRDMIARGLDVVAVYHSHPTSRPVPSRKDLERNYSEDVVNLIVSLTTDPPEVAAWWLTATAYRPAEVAVG